MLLHIELLQSLVAAKYSLFNRSVMSDSWRPHGLQHSRLTCRSPSPGACSNACSLSRWCHPTILFSVVPFSSCLQSFPASGFFFFTEPALPNRWPKYWSFSISSSKEYSGLISFRIDWFDLFAVQETQKSSPTQQFKSINSLALSLLYGLTLTSIHDYWKNHSFDYTDLCWQSNVCFLICCQVLS